MLPQTIEIEDYNYHLPEEKIAKYPLPARDISKLLIYKNGLISESVYRNLATFLPSHSFLVFNNTKVVEVRLYFTKPNGTSTIEIFCLEPAEIYKDITAAMLQTGSVRWKCLVGGAKKWKEGILQSKINFYDREIVLEAKRGNKQSDAFLIEFNWNDESLSFAEILHLFGNIPLPPYLNRDTEEEDKNRYQTVYAKWDGSVAAPTAGLHFTDRVLTDLAQKGVTTGFVTLHVGAGTFKPVKTKTVAEHEMHAEFIDVSLAFIEELQQNLDRKVVAVGTTSLRTLESLYWMGVKVTQNPNLNPDGITLLQWEAYHLPQDVGVVDSLEALCNWLRANNLQKLITKTQVIIVPGYRFQLISGLITNFHQPQSTLLLLIAALVGNQWKNIYNYALQNNYRFLSYGDGSLLWCDDRNGKP